MTQRHNAPRRPVMLVILDGFGINPSKINNAVAEANTPNLDQYLSHHPHTALHASGTAVGLPDGQMGNSEVGHLTLGCGEVIRQNLVLIDDAIRNGEFFSNPALLNAVMKAKSDNRPLHLFGLVSNGGVHSHINHLKALIQLCRQHQVKPVLHMVTDGRDCAQQSALQFLNQIEPLLEAAGGVIATLMGRFYAMDRDNRWDRIQLAWNALTQGKGRHASSARNAIENAYANNEYDEFIRPMVISANDIVKPGDQLISFNFRKDRAKQIIAAIGQNEFNNFDRGNHGTAQVTCMMPYDINFGMPTAFIPDRPETTLGQIISEAGLNQFHCAETEKYAHVTYFFNGGQGEPYTGETQRLIPSPQVATYDLKPEMSADQVADATINAIQSNEYGFIVVNFANGDMVGHSAVKSAAIKAVEALDREVGRLLDAATEAGYSIVLTADHGNCEEICDPISGEPHTQHTTYPVPCMIIDQQVWQLSCTGGIANVAPTILQLMGLVVPASMQNSLLIRAVEQESHYDEMVGAA